MPMSDQPNEEISKPGSQGHRLRTSIQSLVRLIPRVSRRRIYSEYFDAEWYVWAYPEVAIAKESHGDHFRATALEHYLTQGWRTGLNPNPYLDVEWYLLNSPGVRKSGKEPLHHYVTRGWREGLSPSVYFDTPWYLHRNPDIRSGGLEPLLHYLRFGWREGRSPSIYFDAPWYGANRPDVTAAGIEPLRHYLMFGWVERTSPSVYFDIQRYMKETGRSDGEPLKDYLTSGWRAGRRPVEDFDPDWYNMQRARNDTEPLKSYVSEGWRKRHSPNAAFDIESYIRAYPDSSVGQMEPFRHSLLSRQKGIGLGTSLRASRADNISCRRRAVTEVPGQSRYFALSASPLVSIIIPNMNGARHLHDLFTSLGNQTYENFEVIFVDDGSDDDSVNIARSFSPKHIVYTGGGANFARANNAALPYCSGELIALLNNDMRVDPNWLDALVTEIRQDPLIAAIAPKLRFWTKFQTLTFSSDRSFTLDIDRLQASLEYKKYFVPVGIRGDRILGSVREKDERIVLHVPVQNVAFQIHLEGTPGQIVTVSSISTKQSVMLGNGIVDCEYRLEKADLAESYHIVNNAGSILDANGNPGDRGFGYVDDGEFSEACDLDLFCGGAVLIRRDALHQRELFISEMGAYYEDSELSIWLRDRGYRIRFCPSAIVYHKHSATTQERSLFWLEHTIRNKIIFDYVTCSPSERTNVLSHGKLHLNHLVYFAGSSDHATDKDRELAEQMPRIVSDLDRIVSLIDAGKVPDSPGLRIGIFNSYWNTLGGGEAHALDIASAISYFGQVELISDRPFDISSVANYFGRDGSAFRKRIISMLTPSVTSDYDIFINSCFQDQTPSLAKKSFYIVSFPSHGPSAEFLKSYYFLANSQFTFLHMQKLWGAFDGTVLYPSVPGLVSVGVAEVPPTRKQKTILSVGRFVSSGHTKCQLEILEAFRIASIIYPDADWRLVLAGSVNDPDYLSAVMAAAQHQKVEIFQNADFSTIQSLYEQAGIYVHASGYGRDLETEPELFEHFGMVVAEAISNGCYPLVFDAAGPKEIIERTGVGRTWNTIDEFANLLAETMRRFDTDTLDTTAFRSMAAEFFSPGRQAGLVRELIINQLDLPTDWKGATASVRSPTGPCVQPSVFL